MLTLRNYQIDLITQARKIMQSGVRSLIIESPCGSGKTVLTASMLKTASDKGMSSLFIVHRRELVKQSMDTFKLAGVPHGVIASGFYQDPRHLVQIASIQTLARRVDWIKKPSLIIWDECHHVASKSWAKIHEQYPDAYHIGLSATPSRLDGTGLGKWFKAIVHGPSVEWLIKEGYLSKYKLYAPSSVNVSGVHTQMGDYNRKELAGATDKPSITGNAIQHYIKYAYGKRAIVFAVSIEHSKHIVADFQKAGISAVHVDGETPTEERDYAIQKFKEGSINVLSNVELFGEGFDLPAVEVAILLQPTKSLGCYIQQAGRVLRIFDGKKEAIILDHAGNCQLHGLPDDERSWSLEGSRKKSQEKPAISVKVCPSCFGANRSYHKACLYCGYVFAVVGREVEHKEGELVEVNSTVVRQDLINELWQAQTRDQLHALGVKRGYKNPWGWAHMILQGRQAKKLNKQQQGATQ